jgi:hypothetical protein
MDNGNGNKMAVGLVIALATTMANGGLFIVQRLFAMDEARTEQRVALEQRLARVESKLDALVRVVVGTEAQRRQGRGRR